MGAGTGNCTMSYYSLHVPHHLCGTDTSEADHPQTIPWCGQGQVYMIEYSMRHYIDQGNFFL